MYVLVASRSQLFKCRRSAGLCALLLFNRYLGKGLQGTWIRQKASEHQVRLLL